MFVYMHTYPRHIQTPAALCSWMETYPRTHCRLGDKQPSLSQDMIYLARLYPSWGTTGSFTLGASTAGSSHKTQGTTDDKSAHHHQP